MEMQDGSRIPASYELWVNEDATLGLRYAGISVIGRSVSAAARYDGRRGRCDIKVTRPGTEGRR